MKNETMLYNSYIELLTETINELKNCNRDLDRGHAHPAIRRLIRYLYNRRKMAYARRDNAHTRSQTNQIRSRTLLRALRREHLVRLVRGLYTIAVMRDPEQRKDIHIPDTAHVGCPPLVVHEPINSLVSIVEPMDVTVYEPRQAPQRLTT